MVDATDFFRLFGNKAHSSASHFSWQIYFGIVAFCPQCIARIMMGAIMLYAIECHSSLFKSLGLIYCSKGHSGHQCSRFCLNDGVSNGYHFLFMRAKYPRVFKEVRNTSILFGTPLGTSILPTEIELNIRLHLKGVSCMVMYYWFV